MFLDMHGLIFYLSISPLAGSTRYLSKISEVDTSTPQILVKASKNFFNTCRHTYILEQSLPPVEQKNSAEAPSIVFTNIPSQRYYTNRTKHDIGKDKDINA